jgi:hypothetical protein
VHTRTCHCYAPTLLETCRWCFRATITTDRTTLSRTTTGAYTQRLNAVRRTLVANHECTNGYDTTAHAQPQSKRPLETLLRSDTEAHQHAMTDSKLSPTVAYGEEMELEPEDDDRGATVYRRCDRQRKASQPMC